MGRDDGGSQWTLIVPLLRFECPKDIALEPGIWLVSKRDDLHKCFAALEGVRPQRLGTPLWLVQNYLLVLREGQRPMELDDMRDEVRVAEEVTLRLRLLKRGPVGIRAAAFLEGDVINKPLTDSPRAHFFTFAHYVVWERAGDPESYSLDDDEAQQLLGLWEATRKEPLLKDVAFRSFFRSFHEPYASDRFLDDAIALEALLLKGDSELSALTYKFALRGAALLCMADDPTPAEYFKRMKDIYVHRSRMAHGSDKQEDWTKADDVDRLVRTEDYLRTCLRYVLDHPEMRSSSKIDAEILGRMAEAAHRMGKHPAESTDHTVSHDSP